MSYRFQKAAAEEKDLSKAEKLTAKAIEYFEAWQEAVKWLDLLQDLAASSQVQDS